MRSCRHSGTLDDERKFQTIYYDMLVVFKSAPILKRALKVKQAMMQLYVLKLLKLQTKYLGRQWRKSNMKTMSAIYQMVRHRMNDDWAYGNDIDARPWDFQAEECTPCGETSRVSTVGDMRRMQTGSLPQWITVYRVLWDKILNSLKIFIILMSSGWKGRCSPIQFSGKNFSNIPD
ncbi:unnamed protein product [Ranitomeya imitator]|uniref:Far11/STRP C-terminal domain-containing protein n=1 Tax=Ranitomeya imitator TaxID=111125 RepID=A0ABN9KWF7_9NEOB|nr:unnamed protein product [Ranitomeya imitator]